jgi:hypothetical protein
MESILAVYLTRTYPNLSTHDIIKLLTSGLTVGQMNDYLSHLCGGLSGVAQLIIDTYSGDANAEDELADALGGNVTKAESKVHTFYSLRRIEAEQKSRSSRENVLS